MKLRPAENLTEEEVKSGLNLVIKDGLASEAMATLTGGAFLVAMALHLGASNFQIGLLAALPTIGNIFQLVAIYFVHKYANRRAITVISSFFARFPLFVIGALPFLFSAGTSLNVLIFLLFFHYFFGSISGSSWTSWMKDLVPEKILGTFFSHRSRLIQILSVILSLVIACALDYIKVNYPGYELFSFSMMFILGGALGIFGIFLLIKTPEPKMVFVNETNIFRLFSNSLKDINFRNLIIFNSFWAFAINLAAPFFSVYLMKILYLPLSYIIALNILSQVTSILFIRVWGRYSDKYSNKTIIRICAPVYIICIFAWTFTTMPEQHAFTIPLLALIFLFNGITTSGINQAISNIGIKLAPKGEAMIYLSVKSMVTALFAAIAPIAGGFMADFFATHQFLWNIEWKSPEGSFIFKALELQQWDFFFVLAVILAIISMYKLSFVKEEGEVPKSVIIKELMSELKREWKAKTSMEAWRWMFYRPMALIPVMRNKIRPAWIENKMITPSPAPPMQIIKEQEADEEDDVWVLIED